MTTRRTLPRSKRLQIGLAIAIVLGALLTSGVTQAHTAVVTGHSTFLNGDSYDPCLASIVGVMRLTVMWFNDMPLVERYNGEGSYIYAIEHGAPDPREKKLVHSGVFYDFVDPNGVRWHVDEAYWDVEGEYVPRAKVNYDNPLNSSARLDYEGLRYYTWIVQVGKAVRDNFAGDDPHDFYNFVNIVDTCKMHREGAVEGAPNPYNHTLSHNMTGSNPPPGGHPRNETRNHTHEVFNVDLWVGKKPLIAPVGTETPNTLKWQANWASQWSSNPQSGQLPGKPEHQD